MLLEIIQLARARLLIIVGLDRHETSKKFSYLFSLLLQMYVNHVAGN